MHRLLMDVLESHPRYEKIAPAVREAFPEGKTGGKMFYNDVLERLRQVNVKGGANSTKDALLLHFVAAARFQAYAKQTEDVREELRPHIPVFRKALKAQTINEWDRFEADAREKAKKGSAGVILNNILGDVVGAFGTGVLK